MNQITRDKLKEIDNRTIRIIINDINKTISHQLQGKNIRVNNYLDRKDELEKLQNIIYEDYGEYL